mmetsp:Transcript_66241/g.119223  ORF Transcript_66241/g.119223 Transcript_66241/m.119223 type:complete len:101 (-) Transcript_66241:77-379(-)
MQKLKRHTPRSRRSDETLASIASRATARALRTSVMEVQVPGVESSSEPEDKQKSAAPSVEQLRNVMPRRGSGSARSASLPDDFVTKSMRVERWSRSTHGS